MEPRRPVGHAVGTTSRARARLAVQVRVSSARVAACIAWAAPLGTTAHMFTISAFTPPPPHGMLGGGLTETALAGIVVGAVGVVLVATSVWLSARGSASQETAYRLL